MKYFINLIRFAKKDKEMPPLVPGLGAEKAISLRNKPGGPMIDKAKKKDDLNLKKKLKQQNFEDI